jgi:hypothetical protein
MKQSLISTSNKVFNNSPKVLQAVSKLNLKMWPSTAVSALDKPVIPHFFVMVCVFCLSFQYAMGQAYQPIIDIPVEVDGKNLAFPFTGGLNNPQPNEVDLNDDGILDLFIFDRSGNVGLTFINEGTPGQADYRYDPSYTKQFPELINNWVILRDFNEDGVMDLFTSAFQVYAQGGIIVFTGYYQNGKIHFERVNFDYSPNIIPIPTSGDNATQLYVSNVDYPAIDDMDCDGDMDILTFNSVGGYVELYTNTSLEEGYGKDSLLFELTDNCWGGFFETSIMSEVLLTDLPGDCAYQLNDNPVIEERHPGSTLLTFDADGDGDKDLLLGDITYNTLNLLTNGGDCDQAWITAQDASYPSTDVSVDVPVFPSSFLLDVNNDGAKDLIASANAVNGAENYNMMWWYENVNTDEAPEFEFRQKDFLVEEMLDFGTGAAPAFFDYNADGLLDLVVGSDGYFEPFGERDSRLFLFENVGTQNAPAFKLVDDDYLGLSVFDTFYDFCPAFGDMDNDGDEDLLVGEYTGGLFYAENLAGSGNSASFGAWQYSYFGIDIGQRSTPWIVDLDRDGLKDIIIGELNFNLNFFKNTGTPSEPAFEPDVTIAPNYQFLGNINTSVPGVVLNGLGAPVVLDQEGTHIMFVGIEAGNVRLYNGIEGNIQSDFNLDDEYAGDVLVGRRARPAIADLDNDGRLEMIIGNERGGLQAYQTHLTSSSISPVREAEGTQRVDIYPNPASTLLSIHFAKAGSGKLYLYSSSGQLLRELNWAGTDYHLNVEDLPTGVYFLKVQDDGHTMMQKFVVQ